MNELQIWILVVSAALVGLAHAVVIVRDLYLVSFWRRDDPTKVENDRVLLERNKIELQLAQRHSELRKSPVGKAYDEIMSKFDEAAKEQETP
jgi:hypothetical protein